MTSRRPGDSLTLAWCCSATGHTIGIGENRDVGLHVGSTLGSAAGHTVGIDEVLVEQTRR